MPVSRSIEGDEYRPYYTPNRSSKECRNTTIYCILSLALLILAGAVNSPYAAAIVPGGAATLGLVSIGIVVAVIILCFWQMPRPPRTT
jgi:hypothetical protein